MVIDMLGGLKRQIAKEDARARCETRAGLHALLEAFDDAAARLVLEDVIRFAEQNGISVEAIHKAVSRYIDDGATMTGMEWFRAIDMEDQRHQRLHGRRRKDVWDTVTPKWRPTSSAPRGNSFPPWDKTSLPGTSAHAETRGEVIDINTARDRRAGR